MFITTLKECLPYLSKASIATLIWGQHGVGKSQAIKQYCEENGYLFKDIRLSTLEIGDFLGLPDHEVDAKGNKISTKFITPDWLVDILVYCEKHKKSKAVIFLDEINRARRDVLQAAFQLVLDKAFHNIKLPVNCDVIAAANPNSEEYIVTDLGDEAFMDRFCHIKLTPSVNEWFEHAEKREFDSRILLFLNEQKELLSGKVKDFEIEVKPSRRSWEFVDRLLKGKTPKNLLQELCYGIIGQTATIPFIESFDRLDKPVSAEDVIKNYSKVKDIVKLYSKTEAGGRVDLLNHTTKEIYKRILEKTTKLTNKEMANISDFLSDLPIELAYDFGRKLFLNEQGNIIVRKNQKLLEKISKITNKESA